MTPEEQVKFMLSSLKWNGDGYEWAPDDWDYRIPPRRALEYEAEHRLANQRPKVRET